VLNLLLLRAGYPLALLLRDWRVGYLQALARADRGDVTALTNLLGRAVEAGLDRYLDASSAGRMEDELPLATLAQQSEYSAAHLGWLVRQGRLAATKRGGRWYRHPCGACPLPQRGSRRGGATGRPRREA
jgi:hypothetical protein